MTQPTFVPISGADQVRGARQLEVPGTWMADRPAELHTPRRRGGGGRGTPGPDQGYALRLARRSEGRLVLSPGESADDAVVACALVAARRAATVGRAPCAYDVEMAFELFGCLGGAPEDLVVYRASALRSAAHDYVVQRQVVESVPETTLALSAGDVRARRDEWRQLLGL